MEDDVKKINSVLTLQAEASNEALGANRSPKQVDTEGREKFEQSWIRWAAGLAILAVIAVALSFNWWSLLVLVVASVLAACRLSSFEIDEPTRYRQWVFQRVAKGLGT